MQNRDLKILNLDNGIEAIDPIKNVSIKKYRVTIHRQYHSYNLMNGDYSKNCSKGEKIYHDRFRSC